MTDTRTIGQMSEPDCGETTFVLEVFDVDCDGVGIAWHRFTSTGTPSNAFAMAVVEPGPVSASRVMSLPHFEREVGRDLSEWGRSYWEAEGYASSTHSFEQED